MEFSMLHSPITISIIHILYNLDHYYYYEIKTHLEIASICQFLCTASYTVFYYFIFYSEYTCLSKNNETVSTDEKGGSFKTFPQILRYSFCPA